MAASITTVTTSIGSFNRGPITELFVPPTSCYETLTSGTSPNGYLYAGHYSNSYYDPDCYPSGTIGNTGLEASTAFNLYYYSPAICPSGWATVATFTGVQSGYLEVITLGTGTSAALCCPTGYANDQFGHECSSEITPGQTITYVMPTAEGTALIRGVDTVSSVQSNTIVSMDGVPIWWQASDEAALADATQTTFSAGVTATTSSVSITSPPATKTAAALLATSSSPASSKKSQGGLSTGTKVAIGVVVPVAFLALLGALLVYFRRKKPAYNMGKNHNEMKPDKDLGLRGPLFESDSAPVYELHHPQAPAGWQDRSNELSA